MDRPHPNMFIASADMVKAFKEFLRAPNAQLPQGVFGLAQDGVAMFRGDVLFELKATHGFPLEVAIDRIMNRENMSIDWVSFIEAARSNKWWDFQTYEVLMHAIEDAQLAKDDQANIKWRFQRYVVAFPHPMMVGAAND